MTAITKCPICGRQENVSIKEINELTNVLKTIGAKSVLKYGGQMLGTAIDGFFQTGNTFQSLLARGGSQLGGQIVKEQKRYRYHCNCCKVDWTSDNTNRMGIIEMYYKDLFFNKKHQLPSEPKKQKIYDDDTKKLFWLPLYLVLVIVGLYIFTFTFVDCRDLFKWILYGTIPYVVILYVFLYIQTERAYKKAMDIYNIEYPKEVQFNKDLKEKLNKEKESLIKSLTAKITGKINKVWLEHGIQNGEEYGMNIHVSFDVYNMDHLNGQVSAYFYYSNGLPIKDTDGKFCTTSGEIAVSDDFIPGYEGTTYDDFIVFMPYSQLHINQDSDCYVSVVIWFSQKQIAISEPASFHFNIK